MIFLKAFIVGGIICALVQIVIDKTKGNACKNYGKSCLHWGCSWCDWNL